MEVNPDWWGHTAADARGAATIKDVTFSFRAEREVRTAMVQRNEADVARWVSQEQCKSAPQCKGGPTVETILLRPDTMNPVLADKRIREALALAIDKDAIMNAILGGGEPAAQLVRPEVFGCNPAMKPYPYDPARAKQLIAEAKAAGVPVDTTPLTLIVRRAAYFRIEEAAEAITDMLQQAGLTTIKPQVLENAKFSELYTNPPKPISPERGILAVNSHGNELLDFAQTVRFYYICEGRPSTYCNPVFEEMQKKALPADRVRAGEGLPGDRPVCPRRVRPGPDRRPQFLVRDQPAPGLVAAARWLHHGQGDDAEGVTVVATVRGRG